MIRKREQFLSLTIYPAYADTLKYGNKEQAHPTGCIGVKELKDIHPTLEEKRGKGKTSWVGTGGDIS